MCKYISFSRPDKLYKYIYIFIFVRILYEYFFGSNIPKRIKIIKFPENILVQESFNYLGGIIISLFLLIYVKRQRHSKNEFKKDNINKLNVNPSKIELIFNEIKSSDMSVSLISIIFIMILLFLSIQLKIIFII